MKNRKGKLAMEVLVILIVVVVTSGVMFSLVRAGVLEVKPEGEASVLDTEFIPMGRGGYLGIEDFKFCEGVDVDYQCLGEKKAFEKPSLVFFRFTVKSTTVRGEVILVENYRLKDKEGKVLLEAEEKDNFYYKVKSDKEVQEIYFKDYLVIEKGDEAGKYTLELILENPLLNKKVTLVKEFEVR